MQKNLPTAFTVVLAVAATAVFAQSPSAVSTPAAGPALEFEVASVKPAPPIEPQKIMSGQMHIGMSIDAARVDIGNLSLADLIRIAYRMKSYQVSGPDWMASQRFDIMAKMPEGASKDKVPDMLQALLADRFKLTAHRETKDFPAYALVVGKNGAKLKEAEATVPPPAADGAAPPGKRSLVLGSGDTQVRVEANPDGKGATVASPQFGQMKVSMGEGGMMRMEFARMSMPALADTLSRFTDKPVLDMTELSGSYQIALDLSMDDMRNVARAAGMGLAMAAGGGMMARPRGGEGDGGRGPADAASTPGGSSIFNAIQALGLKMDARKLPIETLVIDHLEKTPTEN
jgi:uncharacterized protein (TIGR03435 family)